MTDQGSERERLSEGERTLLRLNWAARVGQIPTLALRLLADEEAARDRIEELEAKGKAALVSWGVGIPAGKADAVDYREWVEAHGEAVAEFAFLFTEHDSTEDA